MKSKLSKNIVSENPRKISIRYNINNINDLLSLIILNKLNMIINPRITPENPIL
jgi:hypothetical protein